MSDFNVSPITDQNRGDVNNMVCDHWGETRIGYIDSLYDISTLPGFVATLDGETIGSLTWRICNDKLQIMTLVSKKEGIDVGTALIKKAEQEARKQDKNYVLISMENTNVPALGYYQKRGYVLHELHRDTIKKLRSLKPSIPEFGSDGIVLRDQIDLIKALK